jgi:hypothetical protein
MSFIFKGQASARRALDLRIQLISCQQFFSPSYNSITRNLKSRKGVIINNLRNKEVETIAHPFLRFNLSLRKEHPNIKTLRKDNPTA